MPLTDAPGKARALFEARRTRTPIPAFTDDDPDLGMADGYAVQQLLTQLQLEDGDTVIGSKVGLTSKATQEMIGVDSPDYGPVLGSTVYRDGDAIALDRSIAPKIEAEIAFVMGSRLCGPGVSVIDASAAVAGVVAAVEIVDSRFADWRIRLADTVADLVSNGAVATSGRLVPLSDFDPRLVGMVLTPNGQLVDTGAGAAARADLSGANVTATQVLAATSGVAAGTELIDSRYTDYRFTMPDVVADNSSAGRYIVGTPFPVAGIYLRLVGVVMALGGQVVGTASGAASLELACV